MSGSSIILLGIGDSDTSQMDLMTTGFDVPASPPPPPPPPVPPPPPPPPVPPPPPPPPPPPVGPVTSGTYGNIDMDVATLFDHVCRRCHVSPTVAAEDHADAFIDIVNYLIQSWANRGILLWTITKYVMGFNPGVGQYALPLGTEDVISDGLYRTIVRESGGSGSSSAGGIAANAFDGDFETACTQIITNGNISYVFSQATRVVSVGVISNKNSDYKLIVEVSADGTTWESVLDIGTKTFANRYPQWFDISAPLEQRYIRLREYGGDVLDLRELMFVTQKTEIPIYRLSLDQYNSYPNKDMLTTFVNSFWVNKQVPNILVSLWPVPQLFTDSLVLQTKRQVMSVPGFTDSNGNDIEVELPGRWRLAIIKGIAREFARELPDADEALIARLDKDYLLDALPEAESEERDPTETFLTPNLTPYTR